jgi:hypothetical protein
MGQAKNLSLFHVQMEIKILYVYLYGCCRIFFYVSQET